MITIQLTPDDLVKMRFSYSPLLELVMSYCVLVRPHSQGHYRRWVEEAQQAIADLDLTYLPALATVKYYIPDFLTPTPETPVFDIEDEFQRMRAIPNALIRKNVQVLIDIYGETAILHDFMTYPRELLECLIEELRLYWGRTLAHHWPRMMDVLEGDVLFRARQLALEGSGALLTGLDPGLRFGQNRLEYDAIRKPPAFHRDYELHGKGLQLVPTIFVNHMSWQIEPEWQPMMIYQPRGTGLWWNDSPTEPNQSLEIALGAGRARVLQLLATPANTGEIARKLHITAGAASQHLGRLNDAGLAEPRRSGKRVYYYLTRRGEQLLSLFS